MFYTGYSLKCDTFQEGRVRVIVGKVLSLKKNKQTLLLGKKKTQVDYFPLTAQQFANIKFYLLKDSPSLKKCQFLSVYRVNVVEKPQNKFVVHAIIYIIAPINIHSPASLSFPFCTHTKKCSLSCYKKPQKSTTPSDRSRVAKLRGNALPLTNTFQSCKINLSVQKTSKYEKLHML